MFDKFGEFDSFNEINELAENLLNEGDIESLKVVAKENGIQADFVDLYANGEIPELCDKLTAALGKIDVEAAELKPKEIMEDWVEYLRGQCMENELLAHNVRKERQDIEGCIAAILMWSFKNQQTVDKDIIKAAGVSASKVTLGIPGMARAKKIITDYYMGGTKKMKRTKFLKCEPCNTPKKTSKDRVVATSQILEIDGERAVEISLFFGGNLKGRYFADMENHSAWVDGKWYTCRLKNVVRLCEGLEPLKNDYYYCSTDMTWASNEEKERAQDFLDTWSIDGYEENLSSRKKQKAIERKIDRIDQQMADIPCVPEGAESWLEQEIFPGHILFIKKTGKRTAYTCTACGMQQFEKRKDGNTEKRPSAKVWPISNSKQQTAGKDEDSPGCYITEIRQQWVERQFKAACKWSAKGKEIQLFEQIRVIIPKGKCWGKVWYGTIPEADELEQDFWDRNPQNKRFLSSYLYPGNLQEVLPAGELELSGMDVLANKEEVQCQ